MTLGYREARLAAACALGPEGATYRGHEFHYATIASSGSDEPSPFVATPTARPPRLRVREEGRVTGSLFHVIAEA